MKNIKTNYPKAFISYSHDSQEHKQWVLELATRLRASGIDATIDQWDLTPGTDIARFMEVNLSATDRILMICTDRYVEKANAGVGGVGYEKMIITADLLQGIDSKRVIPIIRQNGTHNVPTFLKTKLFIDMSRQDMFEFSFDELLRDLHNKPLFVKPPVGGNPFGPLKTQKPRRTYDQMRAVLQVLVDDYESGSSATGIYDLQKQAPVSRIMCDATLADAVSRGLVECDSAHAWLTDAGKLYAIERGLVSKRKR
jgi:hypothetical protein